jgi:hypothetical protein
VNATPRLLQVADALCEAGLRFLIMGGHAVRHCGIDRNTLDFDFHISADEAHDLLPRLRATAFGSHTDLREAATWRRGDFRRFQIGVLATGKEEWLEFWFRNHLLAPFDELYERREQAVEDGRRLAFLSLPDLIRSKETERDDDWTDVRLLEEILDERHLAKATTPDGCKQVLSELRSRRGFERAESAGLFLDAESVAAALRQSRHSVTCAYLLPFWPQVETQPLNMLLDPAVITVLRG